MEANHLCVGTKAGTALVRDDVDRRQLLARVAAKLGTLVLAYCVMDTHVHVVVEAPADPARFWLEDALTVYARLFNRRHRAEFVLRGPVEAYRPIEEPEDLARAIRYVHENPLKTSPPLAERAIEFPWSSAREYAGLSRAGLAAVGRAGVLLGRAACRALPAPARLADLAPAATPCARPEVLLAAAAETYGIAPGELARRGHRPHLGRARALFLRLGRLESYTLVQLAPFVGRSQPWASRLLLAVDVPSSDIRAARTLVQDHALRRRLPLPQLAHLSGA